MVDVTDQQSGRTQSGHTSELDHLDLSADERRVYEQLERELEELECRQTSPWFVLGGSLMAAAALFWYLVF